jgi:ribosomal protein L11 methyltransferase
MLDELASGAESILDFGTGSGILAVAAQKLNPHAQIIAFDIDPMAVECARKTFNLNLTGRIHCFAGSSESLSSCFEIVVANLTANIHRSVSNELVRLTGNHLILSGITTDQKELTLDNFRDSDLNLVKQLEKNGWIALHLKREI